MRVTITVEGPADEADLMALALADAVIEEVGSGLYKGVDVVVRSIPGKEE